MSDTVTYYRWEGAGTPLPSGHKIIETHNDGNGNSRWAIWDMSAYRPELSDDGTMWLDQERPIGISSNLCRVPVIINADGSESYVGVDAATVFYLSRMFRWTVEDKLYGRYFNVS